FGNDVTAARVDPWIQKQTMICQLGDSDITQCANFKQNHAQHANSFFAFGPAHVILARADFVFNHRIADHELDALRKLHWFEFQRAAIEPQSMKSAAVTRDKLIHDTDPGADKFVFGLLAKASQIHKIHGQATLMQEREANRDFDGCLRTQARAERHVTTNENICAVQAMPCALQRPGNTHWIVAPTTLPSGNHGIEISFYGFVEIL